MRKWFFRVLSVISIPFVLLFNFTIGDALIGEGRLPFDQYLDTEFSPEFSFKKFEQIKPGMHKSEVIGLIGQPLYISTFNGVKLEYTKDGYFIKSGRKPLGGHSDFAWLHVSVKLDSLDHVIETSRVWNND